ncbi:MAG: SPFH domain-containing protein [Anaerolineae bacterium]|nr:SPFH domain-containing protein [Anaerolineae bacterium]
MFNLRKFLQYYARILIVVLGTTVFLFTASLAAVSIYTVQYNQRIIPMCPTGLNGDNLAGAVDPDGMIVDAVVTGNPIPPGALVAALSESEETEPVTNVALTDIVPATAVGAPLNARFYVLESTTVGAHSVTITFANNDVLTFRNREISIPQIAQCTFDVQVTKEPQSDGTVSTVATLNNIQPSYLEPDIDTIVRQFVLNVGGGMLPGIVVAVAALLLCANLINAVFGLDGGGWEFLSHRIFGRPGFSPYLIIGGGKIAMGSESVKKRGGPAGIVLRQDSAIVLESEGALTRVIRGPGFPQLQPFEKIWDIIDLRPQRWPFEVSAITRDGIPITYEVAVKFQVGPTDDDIFKAATCKWIRDAWRTEPDRIMDWSKRVIIGDTEGTMRNSILAQYNLDELLDVQNRQQIRQDLFEMLKVGAAQNFGVEIMEVTLQDVTFKGQVLEEWAKTWKMQRDLEVARIEADERIQEIKLLERARSQVRQEMLDNTIQMLNTMAKKRKSVPVDYVLLSFIDMVEHTAAAQKLFIPEDSLSKLENLKKELGSH